MVDENIIQILDAAETADKYVWIKHRFDRNPVHGTFSVREDGGIQVPLYMSFGDIREGRLIIQPADIEWAHVSTQTTERAICNRLGTAQEQSTLVRLCFPDLVDDILFKLSFYTSEPLNGRVVLGHFVLPNSYLTSIQRSKIQISVLLDVECTEILDSVAINSGDFYTIAPDPNLIHFAENAT